MERTQLKVVFRRISLSILTLSFLAAITLIVVACGSTSTSTPSGSGMAKVNVMISDPATCQSPSGPFAHVYVTITDVKAHVSATAGDNDSGWVDLTPNLSKAPMQVDLLGQANNHCFLATLGDAQQLQPGSYQQIRLILAPNSATVTSNACASSANCVVVASDSSVHTLQLSSESQTGIKIPSGQIASGAFTVGAGQTKDLDLDFITCQSIVRQGNGQYRLKPVLHAGEVSTTSTSINGKVLDGVTGNPVDGKVVVVHHHRRFRVQQYRHCRSLRAGLGVAEFVYPQRHRHFPEQQQYGYRSRCRPERSGNAGFSRLHHPAGANLDPELRHLVPGNIRPRRRTDLPQQHRLRGLLAGRFIGRRQRGRVVLERHHPHRKRNPGDLQDRGAGIRSILRRPGRLLSVGTGHKCIYAGRRRISSHRRPAGVHRLSIRGANPARCSTNQQHILGAPFLGGRIVKKWETTVLAQSDFIPQVEYFSGRLQSLPLSACGKSPGLKGHDFSRAVKPRESPRL